MEQETNNPLTELTEIIDRNDPIEIKAFKEHYTLNVDYLKAFSTLLTKYVKDRDFSNIVRALKLNISSGESFAINAAKSDDLELLKVFIPFNINLPEVVTWASYSNSHNVIDFMINSDLKTKADKPLFYFAMRYIVKFLSADKIAHYLEQLDVSQMSDKLNGLIVDLASNNNLNSDDTIKVAKLFVSKGADMEFHLNRTIHLAFTNSNLGLIRFLSRYDQFILNDERYKTLLRKAIKEKSTPFKFLTSLKEDEKVFLNLSLELYFSTTTKTPMAYLNECPDWQKISVLSIAQKSI